MNDPDFPFNDAILLAVCQIHSPANVGATRTTIRRPPSQNPWTANVRSRGERNSAFNSDIFVYASCLHPFRQFEHQFAHGIYLGIIAIRPRQAERGKNQRQESEVCCARFTS